MRPNNSDSEAPVQPSAALIVSPELVAKIRAGDIDAFEQLVYATYPSLVRFARTFVSDDDADDVVQDVLAAVFERSDRWSPKGNPITYLLGMVRHTALMLRRGAGRMLVRQERAAQDPSLSNDISSTSADYELQSDEDARELTERVLAIDRVVRSLTEHQRAAYDLRYRQGMSIPELSEILGISTRSGEQLMRRIVRIIRERVILP